MESLRSSLLHWIRGGGFRIGQIIIRESDDGFRLWHEADTAPETKRQIHSTAEAARDLAKHDASGAFRPLKSAPSLRRGWELRLPDVAALALALDFFYPAAWANWIRFSTGEVRPTPLRRTLGRQTGIYRITAQLTDDEAQNLVCRTCRSDTKCLRRILWPLDDAVPWTQLPAEKLTASSPEGEAPLLCLEACPLLIGAARRIVRARIGPREPETE